MAILDLIWPLMIVVLSLLSWKLAMRQYLGKPSGVRIWLHFIFFGFGIWGLFTVFTRISPTQDLALLSVRIATLGVVMAYYGWYRFNVPFVDIEIRNSFRFYTFHLLTGANIVLAGFSNQISVRYDVNSGYYFDDLTRDTFFLLLIMAGWGGIWVFRGLKATNFNASFYDPGSRSRLLEAPIYISLALLLISIIILNIVISSATSGSADSTGFIIFGIFVVMFLGYIYGVRPVSTVMVSQKLYEFIIITPIGIPLVEFQFTKEKFVNSGLFAAGITALKLVYNSQFKIRGQDIKILTLHDSVVMISTYNTWMFCLIAEKDTIQTEMLLEEISERLKKSYNFTPEIKYGIMDDGKLLSKLHSIINETVRFSGGN